MTTSSNSLQIRTSNVQLYTFSSFVTEAAHMIIASRVVTDTNEVMQPTRAQGATLATWRIESKKDEHIVSPLRTIDLEGGTPVCFTIYFQSITGKIAVEQWTLRCDAGGESRGPRATGLRGALLMRCVCATIRSLPAHKVCTRMKQQRNRQMVFSVSNESSPITGDCKDIVFPTAELSFGRMTISARFLMSMPEEALQCAPQGPTVIADYIKVESLPSSDRDETRNFFGDATPMPQSYSVRTGSLVSSLASSVTISPPMERFSLPPSMERQQVLPCAPFVHVVSTRHHGGVLPFHVHESLTGVPRHVTHTRSSEDSGPFLSPSLHPMGGEEFVDPEEEIGLFIRKCEDMGCIMLGINSSSLEQMQTEMNELLKEFSSNVQLR